MDAAEDIEICLQRSAGDRLRILQKSIPEFLFYSKAEEDETVQMRLCSVLRIDDLHSILQQLEHFQELPQLLDPVLATLLAPLMDALLQSLPSMREKISGSQEHVSAAQGICQLIYVFSKVRGPKTVAQFFANDAKYIEPIVQMFEIDEVSPEEAFAPLSWEERYVLLLWMSHLVLMPFPLSSAATLDKGREWSYSAVWSLPDRYIFIRRLLGLGLHFWSSSGKEREAAVSLLVRLVIRPDIQRSDILGQVILWSVMSLQDTLTDKGDQRENKILYHTASVLSFLKGVLKKAEASQVGKYIHPVLRQTHLLEGESSPSHLSGSAVVRVQVVKLCRSAIVVANKLAAADDTQYGEIADRISEDGVNRLLIGLTDRDAPVRFAASKGLSIVIEKLQYDMATEIIDSILSDLEDGIIWLNPKSQELERALYLTTHQKDLSQASSFHWQGSILTFAHLLFRRGSPAHRLTAILNYLLIALSFEQRSPTGSSLGHIVRDAANFGIWSLARGYSTNEIQRLDASLLQVVPANFGRQSVLQMIACELVSASCLDPSGNIRRGASAALQELVGRHSDVVVNGIDIVQVVDYHAVSLRKRSIGNVARAVAALSDIYRHSLLKDLIGWRGIYAADATSRRLAAETFSLLTESLGSESVERSIRILEKELQKTSFRDVERRHGLLLTLSELIAAIRKLLNPRLEKTQISKSFETLLEDLWNICKNTDIVNLQTLSNPSLRPALTAEAICSLITQLSLLTFEARDVPVFNSIMTNSVHIIDMSLKIKNNYVTEKASRAAQAYLRMYEDDATRDKILTNWFNQADESVLNTRGHQLNATGWLCLISQVFPDLGRDLKERALNIHMLAMGSHADIDTRVAALESLGHIGSLTNYSNAMFKEITLCLQDYTTDQRGDIGSTVRIAALRLVSKSSGFLEETFPEEGTHIEGIVCGLAVEKLDKVRAIARDCLTSKWNALELPSCLDSFSDLKYFKTLLTFANNRCLLNPLMLGYVTSISGAASSVSKAARKAAEIFLASSDDRGLETFLAALVFVLGESLNDERIIIATLEAIAFALESRLFARLNASEDYSLWFKELFMLTQKAHTRTRSMQRLLAAIRIYECLIEVKCIRTSVLKKLLGLLLHPFPSIRQSSAEALFCATNNDRLLPIDWSSSVKDLSNHVRSISENLIPVR